MAVVGAMVPEALTPLTRLPDDTVIPSNGQGQRTLDKRALRDKAPQALTVPGLGRDVFSWQRVKRARSFSHSRTAWSSRYLPGNLRTHLQGPMVAVMILWN